MSNGISIAGSSFVDNNKIIDDYPQKNMLGNIKRISRHLGGCVCNTALSIKKIDPNINIDVFTGVGDDSEGNYIIEELKHYQINTENIVKIDGVNTGFTDVMTIESTGERTFFTYEGANELYSPNQLNINNIKTDIFHIGYIFLLKKFDEVDPDFGTVLAKTLKEIQNKGIKTSIDLVSKVRDDFSEIVRPSLKYCNYLIVNEVEGGMISEIDPISENGNVDEEKIEKILKKIIQLGVKDLAVIHSPEGGWAMDSSFNFYFSKSLSLPKKYIKSSVGAGDAFCGGMLYSIQNNFDVEKALHIANTTAAMSLGELDSVSGIKELSEFSDFERMLND